MIEDYSSLTVNEAASRAERMNSEKISEFIDFERQNKDRVTLIRQLEDLIVEVTPSTGGYVAGYWFDEADETRVVKRDTRVEEAIKNGELETC